eukprot:jgi/Chlat1/6624/Chrsp482S06113
MGKKGGKAKKPGKGREKTEKKTAKKEEKRARKEDLKTKGDEDDIDAILASIKKKEAERVAVDIEDNVPAPSPRCNATLTVNPIKDTELVLYGGEYYNGDKTYVYGDLYVYSIDKGTWRKVSSPSSPPPRSGHQAAAWKSYLFIFGGEFTLDLNTWAWEELSLKNGPTPRSGHRMALYKHQLFCFGGFYDAMREASVGCTLFCAKGSELCRDNRNVRYFNDLFVLNLEDMKWTKVEKKLGAISPSPRSATQLFTCGDTLYLYGGYYKDSAVQASSAKGTNSKNASEASDKGVVYSDAWSLDPRTLEWDKVKRLGSPPGPRAGFTIAVHKTRAILFGGVVDVDTGEDIESVFQNEMFAFQADNRRWYPFALRKQKTKTPAVKAIPMKKPNKPVSDDDDNKEDSDVEVAGDRMDIADAEVDDDVEVAASMQSQSLVENTNAPQTAALPADNVVAPCGRMNANVVVTGNNLYLYGGIMEIGSREVTLDDMWRLDLNKLDAWQCINSRPAGVREKAKPMHKLKPQLHAHEAQQHVAKASGKKLHSRLSTSMLLAALECLFVSLRREKLEKLRAELGLGDVSRTPQAGETLREFFVRTSQHWQLQAYEITSHTGKALRRDGFELAEARYLELRPILDEVERLEKEQEEEEKEAEKRRHEPGSKDSKRKGRR